MFDEAPAQRWPEFPYPGGRPSGSFVVGTDEVVRPVTRLAGAGSGPGVGRPAVHLDQWLAAAAAAPLAERVPVLAYGSNINPMKLVVMARAGVVPLPAVLMTCRLPGFAAVWCAGVRARDGLPPATLIPMPGVAEWHAVALCTPAQVSGLDEWEGAGQRYARQLLDVDLELQDGTTLAVVWAYVGLPPGRSPALDERGCPMPLSRYSQAQAAERLAGLAAGRTTR